MAVTQTRTDGPAVVPPAPRKTTPRPKPAAAAPAEDTPFWEWLQNFSSDEWQYIIAYLWRTAPTIDRRTGGKPTSICKYSRPFDMETVRNEYGSGSYRIDVVKVDPVTTKHARIRQEFFSIVNYDYPPKVPLGEWINDAENEMWKWAEEPLKIEKAKTDARIKQIEEGGPIIQQAGAVDPNETVRTILAGVQTLRGDKPDNGDIVASLVQMVLAGQAAMAEMASPERLRVLINELKPTGPAVDPAAEFYRKMYEDQKQELKEIRAELTKPKPTILEQLKEAKTQFEELAPNLGFSRRNNAAAANTDIGSSLMGVLEKVLDKAAPYIPMVLAKFAQQPQAGQAPANYAPNSPQQQWAPPPIAGANPQPATPPTVETQPANMPELTPEQQQQLQELEAKMQAAWVKYQQLFTSLAPHMIDRFTAGETGYEFRDWFISRQGIIVFNQLRDDTGAEVMTRLLSSHPGLSNVMKPAEKVYEFFQEFYTTPGEEPEGAVVDDQAEEASA